MRPTAEPWALFRFCSGSDGAHAKAGMPMRCFILLALLCALLPCGCSSSPDLKPADFSGHTPIVRVLILQGITSVQLTATRPPIVTTSSVPSPHRLEVAPSTAVPLTLSPVGWRLGD